MAIAEKSAIVNEAMMPKSEIPMRAKTAKSMAAERMRRKSVTSESSPTTMHRTSGSER